MFFLPAQRHHEKDILSSHIRTDVMARVQRLGIKQGCRKGSGERGGVCAGYDNGINIYNNGITLKINKLIVCPIQRFVPLPPLFWRKGMWGGGGFCTFPIKSVREEINAKRTIPI